MTREDVLLVVLERGGCWPECIEECRWRDASTVVLAQGEDETPSELAQRACRRLARLMASGRGLRGAAIATNRELDDDVNASRCAISQAVIQGMRQATDTEKKLWLVAPEQAPQQTRHELMGLAGTLTSGLTGPDLSISVKFPGSDLPAPRSDLEQLVPLRRSRTG
jgi:hypothetical protein